MSSQESEITSFKTLLRLMEAGKRMELQRDCILSAAMYFHRFQQKIKIENAYQQNIIAATSLLIASKVFEKEVNIRVLATIYYNLLFDRNVDICNPDEKFTGLMKFIKDMELYMLRVLKFDLVEEQPLHYLLLFLKFVLDIFPPDIRQKYPIERTCFSLMDDAHLVDVCIKYKPSHLAIAVIFMSLLSYAVTFPGCKSPYDCKWIKAVSDSVTEGEMWRIIDDILDIYLLKDIL